MPEILIVLAIVVTLASVGVGAFGFGYGSAAVDRMKMAEEWEEEARRDIRALYERFTRTVIEMREKGFTTIPEDDHFGSYAITPEMEAAQEQAEQQKKKPNGEGTPTPPSARNQRPTLRIE